METKIKTFSVLLLAIVLFACGKQRDEYVDNVINHDEYKPGDAEKAYAETFSADFRKSIESFENKFDTKVNKIELLKYCGKYSWNKFTDKEVENFKKQIDIFVDYTNSPTFRGKQIDFLCYKGRQLFGYGSSGIEYFDPIPIKSIAANADTPKETLMIYSEHSMPAELVVHRFVENQDSEPRLLESQAKLRNMSVANFDRYLTDNIVVFHEDLVKIIKDGSAEFNETLLNKLISDHFSANHKLIKLDWDNSSGIFSRSNYIRVLFGSDTEIIDYKITLKNFYFSLDAYMVDAEKERLLGLLLKKGDLTEHEQEEVNSRFLTATAFYDNTRGTSRVTLYKRNGSGRITSFTESECDGDNSLFISSGDPIFSLKDHSRCKEKVEGLDEKFQLLPFKNESLLEKEGLEFDKNLTERTQVVVAQIGAGVEYNNPKVNWRLQTSGNQLVSYNQLSPNELPFESYFFNNPFGWSQNFAFGSALASLSAYGSQHIRIIPVKIDPFSPDFDKVFNFLETQKVQLVMVSPSTFKYLDSKKAFESLNAAIQKHRSIFVIIDSGNQGKNLNQAGQNMGCIQSSRSIVVTSSRPNEVALTADSNFGNKCVELALDGSHFLANRTFTKRVNEKFNSTDPDIVASAFAAAKLTNYIAKNVLIGKTGVESAKGFVLGKATISAPLKPYVQEGRVLSGPELQSLQ